ncbi:MAG: DUF2147 domain-containing protein [Mangrovicoccus sp.]|nr:DUF2147 domain-containing protein [Mangrovicoccus sp.]
MKRILALAFVLAAGVAHADPAAGTWKTQPGDDGAFGHVEITPCGAALCGTLIKGFDASGNPGDSGAVGKKIVWDMKPEGGGKYGGGKIWAPDRDKTYNSKMVLSGNSLKVSGCVLGICRNQTWTRVN